MAMFLSLTLALAASASTSAPAAPGAEAREGSLHPAWSPDGTAILFMSESQGRWEIFTMSAGGEGRRCLSGGAPRARNE